MFFTVPRQILIGLHLGLAYVCYFEHRTIVRRFFPEIKSYMKWTFIVLSFYIVVNYFLVKLTHPGRVRISEPPDCEALNIRNPEHVEQLQKRCTKCKNNWKPPRAQHCETCNTCVFRQDHHSEVFDTCLGPKNIKSVVLFSVAQILLALIVLAINITAFILWYQSLKKPILEGGIRITFTKWIALTTTLISLVFLLLGINYIVGFFFFVRDNQTLAEQENGNLYGRPAEFDINFKQVFGHWGWWLPLPASVDVNYLELLYKKPYTLRTSLYLEDLFSKPSAKHYRDFQQYQLK